MPDNAAHTRWWQIFEVVFGIPFLLAIMLQAVVPIPFPTGWWTPVLIAGGILVLLVGVVLVALARREFARHDQPTDPGLATGSIITSGVFSISRNPLYLGGVLGLVGISLAFRLTWELILLIPSIIACHYILIAPEERYMADKFGEPYRAYTASVHRWLGSK